LVASFLAGLTIWFWWTLPKQSCSQTIYFFGRQDMSRSLIRFSKVASIIMSVPVFFGLLMYSYIALQLLNYTLGIIQQELSICWSKTFPDKPKRRDKSKECMQAWLSRKMTKGITAMSLPHYERGIAEALSHLLKTPRPASGQYEERESRVLSDALKIYTVLFSCGHMPDIEPREGGVRHMPYLITRAYVLCLATHVLTLTTTACFIAFIELTIRDAKISGVHTISTTSQLIPTTIGIASTGAAVREMILLFIRRVSWLEELFLMQRRADSASEISRLRRGCVFAQHGHQIRPVGESH
jgi:hypothetical protein